MPPVPPAVARRFAAFGDVPLVAAVSGGRDSVAMLRMLAACGSRPVVGHVVHGLRVDDDDEDAAFVAALAGELGLRCEIRRVCLAAGTGESVEEQARRLRYDSLAEIAADNAATVLTAHTRDDQVETTLFNIIRGTGLRGLTMPGETTRTTAGGRSLHLMRPLLAVSRADLTDWLVAGGFDWRDDPTNAASTYSRNRIRHEVLPLLRSIQPGADAALLTLGELAGESDAVVRNQARCLLAASLASESDSQTVRLHRTALEAFQAPPVVRGELFRLIWRDRGWPLQDMGRRQWTRLVDLSATATEPLAARFDLPGVRVTASADVIELARRVGDGRGGSHSAP